MYKILEAGKLAGNIYQMVVEAPRVAKHCLPCSCRIFSHVYRFSQTFQFSRKSCVQTMHPDPAERILEYAKTAEADMIVLGNRGM